MATSVPDGGTKVGWNCAGWPGLAPTRSSPAWTIDGLTLTDNTASYDRLL